MAANYRRRQRETEVIFTPPMQRVLVETARKAGSFIDADVYAVTTEPTHVHVLITWKHDRTWKSMRGSVRRAMTEAMNERFGKRTWFSVHLRVSACGTAVTSIT